MQGESASGPRRARTWAIMLMAAICLGAASGAARAMEPAVLLDAELERHDVQFVSLREGRLSYFDSERRLSSARASEFVSLRFQHDEPTSANAGGGRLLLADGHDLPGEFAGVDDAGEIIWRHRELGDVSVSLDDILVLRLRRPVDDEAGADSQADDEPDADARSRERRRRFQPDVHQRLDGDAFDAPAPGEDELEADEEAEAARQRERVEPPRDPYQLIVDGADDRVLLRNGDVLTGFIEEVDAEAVHLAVGSRTLPLAWDRVAAVSLANPAQVAPGDWLVLRDGARVRAENLAIGSDELTGEVLGSRALEMPADRVRTIEFTQQHRLVRLAELDPTVVAGGVVFGVPMSPTFGREASHVHAPVTIAIELPSGAKRFTADASLDAESLAWADLELIVRDESGEQFRARLNRDQPAVSVNVAVTGTRLIIEVDEAANGPIMDRLQLDDAAVLVEQ